jgi:hypothetical protein
MLLHLLLLLLLLLLNLLSAGVTVRRNGVHRSLGRAGTERVFLLKKMRLKIVRNDNDNGNMNVNLLKK